MAFALVGSVGAVNSTGSNTANTPSFGTGETRTAGHLLICWVMTAGGGNALPAQPSGWSTGPQVQTTSCAFTIFHKIATGSDSAPTIAAGGGSVNWNVQVAEFSGNAIISPLDQTGTQTGTTSSPTTATAGGTDAASGELIIYCSGGRFTTSVITTQTVALNNGATANTTANTTTNINRWAFGWGVTTGNSGADTAQLTFGSNTSLQTNAVAVASYKLFSKNANFLTFM